MFTSLSAAYARIDPNEKDQMIKMDLPKKKEVKGLTHRQFLS